MQRTCLEIDTEKKVVAWAKEVGITSIKLELKHDVGWPDRMFLIPGGRPLFIEFKRRINSHTKGIQTHRHKVLTALGYDVVVCKTYIEGIDEILKAIKKL